MKRMAILIIGLGYAGLRLQRAFEHAASTLGIALSLAYVDHMRKDASLSYFDRIEEALRDLQPGIVVVSVNDTNHAAVLAELAGYEGFIVCEKPLATPLDELTDIRGALASSSGFALNLVERYSDASRALRSWVSRHEWRLARASFHWGKNRINDYRPTCGVTSEAIHALDLIRWICPAAGPLEIAGALGIRSDFSISGDAVLDSLLLTATIGEATVGGYSSFVNVVRQRTVDLSFLDQADQLIHARLVFDTPRWDHDRLRIWMRDIDGRDLVVHERVLSPGQPNLQMLHKLSRFCLDVVQWVAYRRPPSQPFADLATAIDLQRLLNGLEACAQTPPPTRYNTGDARALLVEDGDVESLG
nr:Gfo/Idh/MocA family oxidoreductase [Stutzerimonas stutzeri]